MTEKKCFIYYTFTDREGKKKDPNYPVALSSAEAERICNHLNSVYNTIVWSYE